MAALEVQTDDFIIELQCIRSDDGMGTEMNISSVQTGKYIWLLQAALDKRSTFNCSFIKGASSVKLSAQGEWCLCGNGYITLNILPWRIQSTEYKLMFMVVKSVAGLTGKQNRRFFFTQGKTTELNVINNNLYWQADTVGQSRNRFRLRYAVIYIINFTYI